MKKSIITYPLITEKATAGSMDGTYVFRVLNRATKPEVKQAVFEAYGTKVIDVRIVTAKAKKRRLGRSTGVKSGYKKAIVRLEAGKKLDILPH